MRAVIWLILLFAAAGVAAITLGRNDGLVSFYWHGWRLDISLTLFVFLLVTSCLAMVVIFRTLDSLISLPKRARQWRVLQRDKVAQASLRMALAEYFGGRYSRAQKSAQRALNVAAQTPELAQDTEFVVLGRLLSAGSAHRLQDRAHRDQQLTEALDLAQCQNSAKPVEEGARLLAAEWALDDRDATRALTMLSELPPGVARRTQALRLRLQAARLADEPMDALRTARLLAKHQAFSKSAAQGLLRSLAARALEAARDTDQLNQVWQQFEASDRRDVFVAAKAAQCAGKLGAPNDGRGWLRPFWERIADLAVDERIALSEALITVLPGVGPEWLPRLEATAQAYPRDPALAAALGLTLAERQLWGKARMVLERCADESALPVNMRRKAWLALAALAQRDEDIERRLRCLDRAANLY